MTLQRPLHRNGALSLLGVATLTIMVGSAIAPGLPAIADHMHIQMNPSWLITLPALGVIVFGPPTGYLIGKCGPRSILVAGLMLYGLLGMAGAVLPSLPLVLLDRFLLGGATAMIMASGTALISDFYDGDARLRMMARQGMAIELGGVVFLSLGGMLAELGWRFPFALYLVAWLFLALVIAYVPQPKPQESSPSAKGNAFSQVGDIYLAAVLCMLLFFVAVIALPRQLATAGHGQAMAGYYLAYVSLVAVAMAALMPRIRSVLGARNTFCAAFLLYGAANMIFALQPGLPLLAIAGLFIGAGFGLSIPLANHELVERSARGDRGRNLAYLAVAIFLGQFLSSFIETASSGSTVFVVAAVFAMISFLLFILVSRHFSKELSHA